MDGGHIGAQFVSQISEFILLIEITKWNYWLNVQIGKVIWHDILQVISHDIIQVIWQDILQVISHDI